MRAMQGCDVVLVDTAGRGPTVNPTQDQTRAILSTLRPDEVHLCVPATMRLDLIERIRADHRAMRPTHAILTKLDEVPADRTISALASLLRLPMQWVTNGQSVPRDLVAAAQPILAPLGLAGRAGVAA
jgi:flagellar biosynthesis protein FlhF